MSTFFILIFHILLLVIGQNVRNVAMYGLLTINKPDRIDYVAGANENKEDIC